MRRRARALRTYLITVLTELESERVDSAAVERARYEGAIAALDALLGDRPPPRP